MATAATNPLISSQTSSELQAILHPLVLLTISDYITRHTLREQTGPIIGALLGQQNGREITIEHAFECHITKENTVEGGYALDEVRFGVRLDQMRSVHKDRGLDLVGWYTLLPMSGPSSASLAIHQQFIQRHNESSVLLGFHPEEATEHSVGGKLPLTIYESNFEHDEPKAEPDGDDKKMHDGEPPLKLKFRELPYTVETGEAEMISMDFVARGGGNATAVEVKDKIPSTAAIESDVKGKKRIVPQTGAAKGTKSSAIAAAAPEGITLSTEEEEMISALTAKVNAIKMLHSRISLITTYLERLPPAYQPGRAPSGSNTEESSESYTVPSNTILRSIQALVNRLDHIVPSDVEAFEREMLREQNDVQLVSLLNDLMQSIHEARQIGKKAFVIEQAKAQARRMPVDFGGPQPSAPVFSLSGTGDLIV